MNPAGSPQWRTVVVWVAIAALLWIFGEVIEVPTTIEVYSDGGRIQIDAAGSTLTAHVAVERVDRVEIRAMDSVFPPGGRSLELRQGEATLLVAALPRRFAFPPGRIEPVGDWEIDDLSGNGVVWARDVDIVGAFDLVATFTGRPHQHLAVTFAGTPTVSVSFRRGLVNNDLFVWDDQWRALAVTSIDPQPAAHLAGVAAIAAHAAAVACALIGLFLVVARLVPGGLEHRPPPGVAGSRAAAAVAGLLGVAALLVSLHFGRVILERLPHTPDSVVYLLQADWLTEGRLTQTTSAIQAHLDVPFTYIVGKRWISHYPPGWPLLLAAGLAVGAPWAVAPILGAVYVLLVWGLGRQLGGDGVGLAAATLAVVSPMSRIIFGSYLSHAGSAVLVLAFLVLLLTARRKESTAWAVAAGVALGLCFGVRPLVAVAAAVPTGLMLLDDLRRGPARGGAGVLVAVSVGGFAGAVPTLIANLAITGSPFAFPNSLARGAMYAIENVPFGLRNLEALLASTVPALHGWGWMLSRSALYLAIPLAFAWIPFLLRRATREDLLLAAFFICLAAVHLPTQAHGLHGYGPRYYFDAFAALFVLSARGFQELARIVQAPRHPSGNSSATGSLAAAAAAILLFAALCVPSAAVLPDRLRLYSGYNGVDGSLERAVERLGIEKGIVLFTTENWRDWAMASHMITDGHHDGLVFARKLDDDSALWQAHPDLPVYGWEDGRLTALPPRSRPRSGR